MLLLFLKFPLIFLDDEFLVFHFHVNFKELRFSCVSHAGDFVGLIVVRFSADCVEQF